MHVRVADATDADTLARLLRSYLDEGYPGHVGCTADELRRDVLSTAGSQHILLVEQQGRAVGFLGWDEVYDMHWAMRGGQIADVYVDPPARGLGAALLLIARACRDAHTLGAKFLRGGAYERASTRAFFSRVAVVPSSGDAHLSGRAFRHLAQLQTTTVRDLLRNLPSQHWNHEACGRPLHGSITTMLANIRCCRQAAIDGTRSARSLLIALQQNFGVIAQQPSRVR